MANVLIAYDVSDKNIEMKTELKRLGYMDHWDGDKTCNLPDTTLWKKDWNCFQAKIEVQQIADRLSIILKRAITVEFNLWDQIEGQPHRSLNGLLGLSMGHKNKKTGLASLGGVLEQRLEEAKSPWAGLSSLIRENSRK